MKKIMGLFIAIGLVWSFSLNAEAETTLTITFEEVVPWGVNDGLAPPEGETVIEETDPDHGGVYDAMGVNFEDALTAPFPIERDGEVYGPGEGFDFAGSSGNVLGFDGGGNQGFPVGGVAFVFDAPTTSISFGWDIINPNNGVFVFMAWNTEAAPSRNPIFPDPANPGQVNITALEENASHYGYTPEFNTRGWQLDLDTQTGHFTFTDMSGTGITAFAMGILSGTPQWAMDNLSGY